MRVEPLSGSGVGGRPKDGITEHATQGGKRVYDTVDGIFADNAGTFLAPEGPDLLGRVGAYATWRTARYAHAAWPYERTNRSTVGPEATFGHNGDRATVVSFGFQDYLSLSRHPQVIDATIEAVRQYGPHSASAPFWQGNSTLTDDVCGLLTELTGLPHIVLFPTGWSAGFGAIQSLVRPYDHIVFDRLSHASLQTGLHSSTPNVHGFRHNDIAHARSLLSDIRAKDSKSGILVVTESLFSLDADYPDLGLLQDTCHEFGATLLVDSAQDLGAVGPKGSGNLGLQGIAGKVDLQCGSFSKTFAHIGGFVACHSAEVEQHIRVYASTYMFSNAPTPPGLAAAREAMVIALSDEGDRRRERVLRNSLRFRAGMEAHGVQCLGEPGPFVPVSVADVSLAARLGTDLMTRGVAVNLVEFPAVKLGTARFRFQLMSDHTDAQLDHAVASWANAWKACGGSELDIDLRDAPGTRQATSQDAVV